MSPTVVIVGRPNVGKSTLFNRLARRRLAIVHDLPGVTRDRKEAPALIGGHDVTLIDTAGLEEAPPDTMAARMTAGSERAVDLADLVLFVIDGRAGLTPSDEHFATWLRRKGRPVVLVVNKAEGRGGAGGVADAFSLGFGDPIPVSADDEAEAEGEAGIERPLRLAIIGRPNAGKSTLVNRLLGEERMLTGPEPGITRDAIATPWRDQEGRLVRLVDTAGLRKRARVVDSLERMSTGETIQALKEAEIVVLVLDALAPMEGQDLSIATLAEREGRAIVLALNKWDLVPVKERDAARRMLTDRLQTSLAQLKGVPIVPLSALSGAGVEKLMPAVWKAYAAWNTRVPTGALNRWFEGAITRHPPPLVDGRRLKLRYITQAKARPPTFVIFGTRSEQLPDGYARYLLNSIRDDFDLQGVPIRLNLRGTKNPYDEG
ncbi:MAG: ribosome biogenesis GTPase Der [Acetobacteraceae bacterium]|nr:ribosome biogenesis GTPase Der [Acetobacteraceae bacterium]